MPVLLLHIKTRQLPKLPTGCTKNSNIILTFTIAITRRKLNMYKINKTIRERERERESHIYWNYHKGKIVDTAYLTKVRVSFSYDLCVMVGIILGTLNVNGIFMTFNYTAIYMCTALGHILVGILCIYKTLKCHSLT